MNGRPKRELVLSGSERDQLKALTMRRKTAQALDWKPAFWSRAYSVGSVGGATLETVRAYVEAQGTAEHARKSAAKKKATPPA
jgi:REP element-mobilizing transposase RayT